MKTEVFLFFLPVWWGGKKSNLYQIGYNLHIYQLLIVPGDISGKEPACQCRSRRDQVGSLGWEDPLKEGMATHCNILAWEIPSTEEPGRL